jgi:hypothetical protein
VAGGESLWKSRKGAQKRTTISKNTGDYESTFDCSDGFLRPSACDCRTQTRIPSETSEGIYPKFHGATGMFPRGGAFGKCYRVEKTPSLSGFVELAEPPRDLAGAVQRCSRFERRLDDIL